VAAAAGPNARRGHQGPTGGRSRQRAPSRPEFAAEAAASNAAAARGRRTARVGPLLGGARRVAHAKDAHARAAPQGHRHFAAALQRVKHQRCHFVVPKVRAAGRVVSTEHAHPRHHKEQDGALGRRRARSASATAARADFGIGGAVVGGSSPKVT
jgi:hypothetical protein